LKGFARSTIRLTTVTSSPFVEGFNPKIKFERTQTINHPVVNPEGIQHSGDFSNITAALVARGYADTDVKKIIGLNFMRLFEEIW
jgi:microsomal dipeptidase-like Zn-dependent dipeptidase